jgi:hypothetical protein
MAAHTLEDLGVFQVREELADEGENHADLILSNCDPARDARGGVSSRRRIFTSRGAARAVRVERCSRTACLLGRVSR